ncbi:unnamed protein product, partial [Porites evermanni]
MDSFKDLLTETVGQIKRANEYLAEQQMKGIKKLKYNEPRKFKKKANEDQFQRNHSAEFCGGIAAVIVIFPDHRYFLTFTWDLGTWIFRDLNASADCICKLVDFDGYGLNDSVFQGLNHLLVNGLIPWRGQHILDDIGQHILDDIVKSRRKGFELEPCFLPGFPFRIFSLRGFFGQ